VKFYEVIFWVFVACLLAWLLTASPASAQGVIRGTAGAPLDDTWTAYHDWRMTPEHMADAGYMPTSYGEPGTTSFAANDALHVEDPFFVRDWQVTCEPDLEPAGLEWWAWVYAHSYHMIKDSAIGETRVGGVALYWCDIDYLTRFVARVEELGARIERLDVHAYMPLEQVATYIRAARTLVGDVPIFITEAGHLGADNHEQAIAYMRHLVAWLADNSDLGIERVDWFVPWDPSFDGWHGWNDMAPGTLLYNEDGSLTPVGQAWAGKRKTWLPEIRGGQK